jgi:sialate O-acetylesterase
MNTRHLLKFAFAMSLGLAPAARASLFDDMFQDHVVLQRDRPVPVWGETRPGERVTVSINGQSANTSADQDGHWRVTLNPLAAGGPYTLKAVAANDEESLHDVLVGDVWLCSGQSNMELPVARSLNAEEELNNAKDDWIRILTVAHETSPMPLQHFKTPVKWAPASRDSLRDFSAACFYFARDLRKTVHAPMGLIQASWSGSRIEPWMSAQALRRMGGLDTGLDILSAFARNADEGNERMGAAWELWWRAHAPGGTTPWKDASYKGFSPVPQPMRDWKTWGVPELATHDGMVWFKRTLSLTKAQAQGAAQLSIGEIDEVDETWVNGHPVGNSFGWGTERTYVLPAGLLHAGENLIVINVLSMYAAGGMYGPPDHIKLLCADGSSVPLGAGWHYQFIPDMGFPPRAPWESISGLSTLYNAMISPLVPYALRGVLWYQGESNAFLADQYQAALALWMADWRTQFAADLPFFIVELPNWGSANSAPVESDWSNLRDAQRRAVLADDHAAIAVTIDVGEASELHPPNKQAVGARLARAARHLVYGSAESPSGPEARSVRRDGKALRVNFVNVEGGLLTYSGSQPLAFEVCGTEPGSCRFVPAAVNGSEVILSVPDAQATRARYCWGAAPLCNLYDKSGLPAGPFEMRIESSN